MMKTFKFIMAAFIAVIISFASFAQENNNRNADGSVVRGPYLTNDFGSNWFVGVGAGINTFYNNLEFGNLGVAVDGYVGKWFTPSVGARVGYSGINNSVKTDGRFADCMCQHYIHADVLWNVSNTIGGYKETRVWDVIPYMHSGVVLVKDANSSLEKEFAAGAGVINEFRFNEVVNVILDLGAAITHEKQFVKPAKGPFCVLPRVTVGLSFNLGKNKAFVRYSSAVTPMEQEIERLTNGLRDAVIENNQLNSDNAELREKLKKANSRVVDTVYVKGDTKVLVGSNIITFPIGKATLTPVESLKVEAFAESLADGAVVKVVGSADSQTGSQKYNDRLAEKRAEAIRKALIKFGVPSNNITTSTRIDATKHAATSRSAILTFE